MSFRGKKSLRKLRNLPNLYIFIVSGRSVKDLKEKISLKGISYIGNHGLEIENPNGIYKKNLSLKKIEELKIINDNLTNALKKFPGIILEDKGLTLSVHYRNTQQKLFPNILRIVNEEINLWKNNWRIISGKMVLEIRPRTNFNKGKTVKELLKKFPKSNSLAIYLGDDKTDDDAFRVLKQNGISVFIGPSETHSSAEFFLHDPDEVQEFLFRCEEIRIKKKSYQR